MPETPREGAWVPRAAGVAEPLISRSRGTRLRGTPAVSSGGLTGRERDEVGTRGARYGTVWRAAYPIQ